MPMPSKGLSVSEKLFDIPSHAHHQTVEPVKETVS